MAAQEIKHQPLTLTARPERPIIIKACSISAISCDSHAIPASRNAASIERDSGSKASADWPMGATILPCTWYQLLSGFDPRMVRELGRLLDPEIMVTLDAKVEAIERMATGFNVWYRRDGHEESAETDQVLIAVGSPQSSQRVATVSVLS